MQSELPKCLHKVKGKEIINYIVEALNINFIDEIIIVASKKLYELKYLINSNCKYVIQEKALGTAHAIALTKPLISENEDLLILPADTIIDKKIISLFINNYLDNKLRFSILTMNVKNNEGFGRVIKNNTTNSIINIIEEKEIKTEDIKNIKEINLGIYIINSHLLFSYIDKIENNNQSKEYYFTDIIKIIASDYKKNKTKIVPFNIEFNYLYLGMNDLEALNKVNKMLET